MLVDKNSQDPEKAFQQLLKEKKFVKEKYKTLELNTLRIPNKVRVVVISDTHSKIDSSFILPDADILIHAGDFTKHGTIKEVQQLADFLDSIKNIKYKIIIAGNHDRTLDEKYGKSKVDQAKEILKNNIYLQDSGIEVLGIKIWGSPWQPFHCGNAFQLHRGETLLKKWDLIPTDTDILITHTPPLGYGDNFHAYCHAGCVDLYNTVKFRVKPKFHVFGHIHEDYGSWTDGKTIFINASICNSSYKADREPILFDIDSNILNKNEL